MPKKAHPKKTSVPKRPSLLLSSPNLKLITISLALIILTVSSSVINHRLSIRNPAQTSTTQPPRSTSLSLPPPPPIPVSTKSFISPTLTAKAAYVVDANSGSVLFQKNSDQPLPPASTTKIMTALVALDTYPLDQIITITKEDRTIGNTMNLISGEQISVENLLLGTLVASGNDAALALALSYPNGGYQGFIKAMNQKAMQLKLESTSYKNVSGVETPGHFSSASDLARLTRAALANPTFKLMVSTQEITVASQDSRFKHRLSNTNLLLGKLAGVTGVKTGWTENAKECLVTSTVREDNQIITVVLGSDDRFGESTKLVDWAYNNHDWVSLDSLLDPLALRNHI